LALHRFKVHAPHEATLTLVFLSIVFVFEFMTGPGESAWLHELRTGGVFVPSHFMFNETMISRSF